MVLKTIKNFYCPKVGAEVHVQYCTQLKYPAGKGSDTIEQVINPDCERKDQCDIARQKKGKTIYNWSGCVHPALQTAVW